MLIARPSGLYLLHSLSLVLLFFASANRLSGQPPCRAIDLRCEHLPNPLGIDSPQPRLSWRLEDNRQGAIQTAFQLCVGSDSVAVSNGKGNQWELKLDEDIQLIA